MAIISDGVTNITVAFVDEKIAPSLDRVSKVSSGGDLKQQVGGERYKNNCQARVSSTLFRQIMDLLNNGATNYFYTPEETNPFYSGLVAPIPVQFSKLGQQWDNRKNHYISFTVEAISYI